MKISAKTDVGMCRASNQDCYAIGEIPEVGAWAVVCDGMGGHAGGNVASEMAALRISERIKTNYHRRMRNFSIKNMLESAIISASADIFERASKDESLSGMGTTAVVAVCVNGECVVASVGDSRCYHIKNDEITQITKDHSLVQELVDSGAITPEEAKTYPMRNVITRSVGLKDDVLVDFFDVSIEKGDKILLCTDGLTNHVSDEEIIKCTCDDEIFNYADRLVKLANEKGGSDNITAVVLVG